MAVEVQIMAHIVDTQDGERMYSCTRAEIVIPARVTAEPDPDVILPLLAQKVSSLTGEVRDSVHEQLAQISDVVQTAIAEARQKHGD